MGKRRIWPLLAAVTLAVTPMLGVELVTVTTATARSNRCVPGPQKSNFSTTDLAVWVFVFFEGAAPGDALNVQWLRPDGSVHYVEGFDPLVDGGDWCFDSYLFIEGTEAANYPGI